MQRRNEGVHSNARNTSSYQDPQRPLPEGEQMTDPNHYDTAVKEFDDLYNAMLELLVDEYEEPAGG